MDRTRSPRPLARAGQPRRSIAIGSGGHHAPVRPVQRTCRAQTSAGQARHWTSERAQAWSGSRGGDRFAFFALKKANRRPITAGVGRSFPAVIATSGRRPGHPAPASAACSLRRAQGDRRQRRCCTYRTSSLAATPLAGTQARAGEMLPGVDDEKVASIGRELMRTVGNLVEEP
jgi:hypothetical protein